MISWIVIGILIILGFLIVKGKNIKHKIFLILLILLGLALYTTLTVVSKQYDLDLSTSSGVYNAFKIYIGWIGGAFSNIKTLIGNAIKMDWKSANSSLNITKPK